MAHRKNQSSTGGRADDLERRAAWKYVGYPGFSRFMASSNDCFALRKFTTLNVRALLKLQNDITELERQLDDMDNFTMNLPSDEGGCASFRLDADSPREELLEEIEAALERYNSRLVNFLQIHERPTPSLEQSRNIQIWLANYPNAIEGPEQEFILHEKDLFAVQLARRTQFGKWMETLGLHNIAGFRDAGPAASGKYYDRNAWKSLGGFFLMICLLTMLLGPLWTLSFVLDQAVRLAVVTAFAVVFGVIVIIGTTSKASHRGASVAGYFAQLVLVFGLTPAWQSNADRTLPTETPASTTAITTTAINAPTSILTQVSTITVTPSTISMSSPAASQTASTQGSSGSGLSGGAITGIVLGTLAFCVVILILVWLRWRRRRIPQLRTLDDSLPFSDSPAELLGRAKQRPQVSRLPTASRSGPAELHGRDTKKKESEMSQAAPTSRLDPADDETVASSSIRPNFSRPSPGLARFAAQSAGEGNIASNVSTNRPPTYRSGKESKGKGRILESSTPLSAATTLYPSSATTASSPWERRRQMEDSTPISAGTTLHPDSAR